MSCLCGDPCCPSCGPAQGYCPKCVEADRDCNCLDLDDIEFELQRAEAGSIFDDDPGEP